MTKIKLTKLRQNLSAIPARGKDDEIQVAVRGKVIARIVLEKSASTAARRRLIASRRKVRVGDVITPSVDAWEAER